MNETQQRIKAYQEMLPSLKEKIVAMALLLALSLTMVTSASFAWLTISKAPELSGVNTTIAANGSLEVALSNPLGTEPGESMVGDSFAAEGQSVVAANMTWGNLINLSDPVYGLDHLIMRPAQLNRLTLAERPLSRAMYGRDGRIETIDDSSRYTSWVPPEGLMEGYFELTDSYGVRAISSVNQQIPPGADAVLAQMLEDIKDKSNQAGSMYKALGNNSGYMNSLATMMGLYMTARMNPDEASLNNPEFSIEDIQNLSGMYKGFLEAMDKEADALADLANIQLYFQGKEGTYTAETILQTTSAKLKNEGIQITRLEEFVKDRNVIASDYQKLQEIASGGGALKWSDSGLNTVVNNLVDVGKCTIGKDNTPISSIGASNAMSYLSGTQDAKITNGILYRFEERCGAYLEVKDLSISATVKRYGITVPATVKANVQTTASRDYNLFNNDYLYAESLNTGDAIAMIEMAEDTYGLAIDFWVRTNSQASYLVLEGNVLSETTEVDATGLNSQGEVVDVYIGTVTWEDENTGEQIVVEKELYQENDTWYDLIYHTVFDPETEYGEGIEFVTVKKRIEQENILGYEGVSRIWSDNEIQNVNSTSQGSGSCYVYYADTPEDQAQSLKLLEAFNVAFVDSNGKLLASAYMDTTKHYSESGRVIVPLKLDTIYSKYIGINEFGEELYGIMNLEQNVAERITAIVYLDGTKLSNDDVLSAADIEGQLNIQFGTSNVLTPISNEKLETAERTVDAYFDEDGSVTRNMEFDYDTVEEPMTVPVRVEIKNESGENDKDVGNVTAFFIRQINSTQGSREEEMTFTKNSQGVWEANYTFEYPGNYIIRSVQIDGKDYSLKDCPKVVVKGFEVSSLSCKEANGAGQINIMTAGNSSTVNLSLQFMSDNPDRHPKKVQGRFLRQDGSAVNIDFIRGTGGIWSGKATFISSGEYKLQYLVLDGEYMELDESKWQTANVYLGMRAAVYTTSPHSFKYIPSEMTDNQKELAMQVKIMDDTGKVMEGITGARMVYSMKGSGVKTMDTDLEWNPVSKYYEGTLHTLGPGIFQFKSVTVGDNVISATTTYPTFTVLSPEPPEYYDHGTSAWQFAPEGNAVMKVQITNSAAATVQALITKDGSGEGVWVDGTIGGEFVSPDGATVNHWTFVVPRDGGGFQDGDWKITQLKIWDVFGSDGTPYTETDPMYIDVSREDIVSSVISEIKVTFTSQIIKNFGKDDAGTITGEFMNSHTLSGVGVDIKDHAGRALSNLADVKLKLTLDTTTTQAHGGYSSTGLTIASDGATIVMPLVDSGNGIRFVQDTDVTLVYAGKYNVELSFNFANQTSTYSGTKLPENAPQIAVWSKTPTVKISNVTPSGSVATDTGSGDDQGHTTVTVPAWTDTSATVYIPCERTESSNCGNKTVTHSYETKPVVTLTLNGYGSASEASLVFTGTSSTVDIYDGSTQTDAYKWTANGDCARNIGYLSGTSSKRAAGTLKANTLTLIYKNVTYTVSVPEITINNPY